MRKGFALNWVVANDGRSSLFGPRDLEEVKAAGAQVVRFELRLGAVPDWNDALIGRFRGAARHLRDAGIEPIGLIYGDAVSHSSQADWNAGNSETGAGSGDNPFIGRFTAVAAQLAGAIPEIALWEIWNEPNAWRQRNGNAFSGGSFIYPSNYARLLTRAAVAIQEAHPGSTIITGGLLSHNIHGVLNPENCGAEYLQAVYEALRRSGGKIPFDAIGQHLYMDQPGRAQADHLSQYINHVQAVVQRNEGGNGRPMYITEAAWTTSAVQPDVQAANLKTLFEVCGRDERIQAVCWFQVKDNPPGHQYFGVCAPNWSRKPAFAEYQAVR
jgi:hypothetical protein